MINKRVATILAEPFEGGTPALAGYAANRSVTSAAGALNAMTSESRSFAYEAPSPVTMRRAIQKRVEEIVAERFARAEKRRLALEELKSVFYSPAHRIAAWEKLHELRLPLDAHHPVLLAIATSTALSLAEVRDEQRLRSLKVSDPPT